MIPFPRLILVFDAFISTFVIIYLMFAYVLQYYEIHSNLLILLALTSASAVLMTQERHLADITSIISLKVLALIVLFLISSLFATILSPNSVTASRLLLVLYLQIFSYIVLAIYISRRSYSSWIFLLVSFMFVAATLATQSSEFLEIQSLSIYDRLGDTHPIGFGRSLGMACIVFYLWIWEDGVTNIFKLLLFPVLCVSLVLLIATGSKGPLYSTLILMAIFLFFNDLPKNAKGLVLSVFLLLYAIYTMSLSLFESSFIIERFTENTRSYEGRSDIYIAAINTLSEYSVTDLFFGRGLGIFGMYSGEGFGAYPHNIFLETALTNGLLGLGLVLLLSAVIVREFVAAVRLKGGFAERAPITMALFSLLNSLVSGDLAYNSGIVFFYLLHVYVKRRTASASPLAPPSEQLSPL